MERLWNRIKSMLSDDNAVEARRERVLRELRERQAEEDKTDRKGARGGPIRRLFK